MTKKSDRQELLNNILAWRIRRQEINGLGYPKKIRLTEEQHKLIGADRALIYGMWIVTVQRSNNAQAER